MKLDQTIPKDLRQMDWGPITPEFAQEGKHTLVHVFNHYLMDEESVDRAVRFAAGRIRWIDCCLGRRYRHLLVFDDVGQDIGDDTRKAITKRLKPCAGKVRFMSRMK